MVGKAACLTVCPLECLRTSECSPICQKRSRCDAGGLLHHHGPSLCHLLHGSRHHPPAGGCAGHRRASTRLTWFHVLTWSDVLVWGGGASFTKRRATRMLVCEARRSSSRRPWATTCWARTGKCRRSSGAKATATAATRPECLRDAGLSRFHLWAGCHARFACGAPCQCHTQ